MSAHSITIGPDVVEYLRGRVRRQMSSTAASLSYQLGTVMHPDVYEDGFRRRAEARALFDAVRVTEPDVVSGELRLDLDRYSRRLVLRALRSQRDQELRQWQDLAPQGQMPPPRKLAELARVVTALRQRLEAWRSTTTRPPLARRRRG